MIIGIETDRGPWAAALIAAGYTVFPVNPLQASRYRERHGVSAAKSDGGDAHMLADMVRTDSHQLRPAAGDVNLCIHGLKRIGAHRAGSHRGRPHRGHSEAETRGAA